MKPLIAILIFCFLLSCSKEKESKFDWQLIDNAGNTAGVVYNKTEAELVACLTNETCGSLNGGVINSCNYYKLGDPTFCWNINGEIKGPMTQKLNDCFARFPDSLRLPGPCTSNPCVRWYTRYRRTHKPTGATVLSVITSRTYCNTDTLALFNNPNPIVIKDDADSLVLWQRTKTGTDFY